MTLTVSFTALSGVPIVESGEDLVDVISGALATSGESLVAGDVLVIAQKIVSKAEGRLVPLNTVAPSTRAREIAHEVDKDPRLVELILSETSEIMRKRPGVLIVRHKLGFVLANAGIDQSNVDHRDGPVALLLPENPDASCAALRARLKERTGLDIPVLIVDSLGRAWRSGTVGTAIGVNGIAGLVNLRGEPDLFGRKLETSDLGLADEIASAASLTMGQAGEGTPIVLVRGLATHRREAEAAELVRPLHLDLFR